MGEDVLYFLIKKWSSLAVFDVNVQGHKELDQLELRNESILKIGTTPSISTLGFCRLSVIFFLQVQLGIHIFSKVELLFWKQFDHQPSPVKWSKTDFSHEKSPKTWGVVSTILTVFWGKRKHKNETKECHHW